MNSCSNCLYFFKPETRPEVEGPNIGQCRVRAPTVGFVTMPKMNNHVQALLPAVERATSFPSVSEEVWCGEWAPKG